MSAKRLKDLVQMRPALDQVLQHIKSNRWREARAAIDALQEPVKRGHRHNEPKNPRYPVFPEDKYIRALYRRVPAVRQLPIDLRAEERERTAAGDDGDPDRPPMTHFAKRFGLKQLELVEEKGMTEDAAFDEVWRAMEGELDAELDKWVRVGATVPRGPLMMVRTIQLEEEKVLREGLLQRVAEFGQEPDA
ncbi:unnamed protein product [Pedinophyceae sp. YPF-701]|nr:unnamed protein product [Pedinophyceae sp. YPF-701]